MLEQILSCYQDHLDLHRLQVHPLENAGGFSGAMIWKVESAGQVYCLRKWPNRVDSIKLRRNHRVLNAVGKFGCNFVPVPIPTAHHLLRGHGEEIHSFVCSSSGIFQLEPWMPGRADFMEFPTRQRLTAAVEALARFHLAVDGSFGYSIEPCPAVQERQRLLERLVSGEFAQIAAISLSRAPPAYSSVVQQTERGFACLADRLLSHLQDANRLPVRVNPVIRDVWHDHVLFIGQEVTGIIDYGAMRDDSRSVDLSRMLGSFCESDTSMWHDALEAYQQVSAISDNERALLKVLDQSTILLSLVNWLRWLFVDRRSFALEQDILPRLHHFCDRLKAL